MVKAVFPAVFSLAPRGCRRIASPCIIWHGLGDSAAFHLLGDRGRAFPRWALCHREGDATSSTELLS